MVRRSVLGQQQFDLITLGLISTVRQFRKIRICGGSQNARQLFSTVIKVQSATSRFCMMPSSMARLARPSPPNYGEEPPRTSVEMVLLFGNVEELNRTDALHPVSTAFVGDLPMPGKFVWGLHASIIRGT
ncbi:hypothetical protein ACLKA6_001993 [Drosophila palustris]